MVVEGPLPLMMHVHMYIYIYIYLFILYNGPAYVCYHPLQKNRFCEFLE